MLFHGITFSFQQRGTAALGTVSLSLSSAGEMQLAGTGTVDGSRPRLREVRIPSYDEVYVLTLIQHSSAIYGSKGRKQ